MPSRFGTVRDYVTGELVREATGAEWLLTALKTNSGASDSHTGVFTRRGEPLLWVDGGPDTSVTVEDVAALRQAAASAGDLEQVRDCKAALRSSWGRLEVGDPEAFERCAAVILAARVEFAA